MKKILFAVALVAALIPFAVAQDSHRLPQPSLDREVDVQIPARPAVLGNPPHSEWGGPPTWCKPCLFYAGEFDSNASDANGLANEVDVTINTGAATYPPFLVPTGKTWTVTGLLNDEFLSAQVLDPKTTPYEVRSKIPKAGGTGGKLVCHGSKTGSLAPTGLSDFGFNVYSVKVKGITNCVLNTGKYWMTVIPNCTNSNDSTCTNGYRGFTTNNDGAMKHKFGGTEPANNSFFNSVFFGATWVPSTDEQSSSRFTIGVEGTSN